MKPERCCTTSSKRWCARAKKHVYMMSLRCTLSHIKHLPARSLPVLYAVQQKIRTSRTVDPPGEVSHTQQ